MQAHTTLLLVGILNVPKMSGCILGKIQNVDVTPKIFLFDGMEQPQKNMESKHHKA